jgi:hypothetical protein
MKNDQQNLRAWTAADNAEPAGVGRAILYVVFAVPVLIYWVLFYAVESVRLRAARPAAWRVEWPK